MPKLGDSEARFRSPFVSGDEGHHLYVNLAKQVFYCFKSDTGGSLSYLFSMLGADYECVESLVTPEEEDKLRSRLRSVDLGRKLTEIDLSEVCMAISESSPVRAYAHERGLTDEDIEFYRLGEGVGDHAGRIVIPSFDRYGRCEYWVSRSVERTDRMRFMNPKVSKGGTVFFLDLALRDSSSIIVCEGVFSAIAAGRNAVATLGKHVSNAQISRILTSGTREVTLCLDGDAWKQSIRTAKKLISSLDRLRIVVMPVGRDPADMGHEEFCRYAAGATIEVNDLSLLRLRAEES